MSNRPENMLEVDVQHRLGDFKLACRFESDAHVTGLFGPSGAGKSTLLRILAGLIKPDSGRVILAGRCVFDSDCGLHVPAYKRRIGYVFQRARLFTHLNVRNNLRYGQWFAQHGSRNGSKRSVSGFDSVVEILGIRDLLERRIAGLSGGEQQRVAIGRALLANPAMLLLDEPLASLDAPRKQEILPYIERLGAEVDLPIVYVSHQLDELLRMANRRVVALRDGKLAYAGNTADFLAHPHLLGRAHAREAGALLHAELVSHQPDYGLSMLKCEGQSLYVPQLPENAGPSVTLHVRASDVTLAREVPKRISALNILTARIASITPDGEYAVMAQLRVGEQTLAARITRKSADALELKAGERVHVLIKSLALAEQAWQRQNNL